MRLAADYGAFVYGGSAGTDLGLIGSAPTQAAEVYAGVRGFGRVPFSPLASPTLAGALTVGAAVPWSAEPDAGRTLFELTLLASGFSGALETLSVQPVGFSLVPAVGFTF